MSKASRASILLGLWSFSVFLAGVAGAYFSASPALATALPIAAVLWPLACFILAGRPLAPRGGQKLLLLLFAFLIVGTASTIGAGGGFEHLANLVLTVVALFVAIHVMETMEPASLLGGLKIYSLPTMMLAAGLATLSYSQGARLGLESELLNPSAFGLIGMSVAVCALAWENLLLRLMLIATGGYLIYLTGSRGSLLGTMVGVCFYCFYTPMRGGSRSKLGWLVAAQIVLMILIVVFWDQTFQALDGIFLITDQHRGLDAGGSGRFEIWMETLAVIREHPILGVGYRLHPDHIGASSAHNGLLALFADLGAAGLLVGLAILVRGVARWHFAPGEWAGSRARAVAMAVIASYLSYGLFERYLFNIGNPASIFFMVLITGQMVTRTRESEDDDAESNARHD